MWKDSNETRATTQCHARSIFFWRGCFHLASHPADSHREDIYWTNQACHRNNAQEGRSDTFNLHTLIDADFWIRTEEGFQCRHHILLKEWILQIPLGIRLRIEPVQDLHVFGANQQLFGLRASNRRKKRLPVLRIDPARCSGAMVNVISRNAFVLAHPPPY